MTNSLLGIYQLKGSDKYSSLVFLVWTVQTQNKQRTQGGRGKFFIMNSY